MPNAALSAGSAYVPIKPTFPGFQKQVASQASAAGAAGGKKLGTAYGSAAQQAAAPGLRKLGADLGKARSSEAAAAGRVKVAEANLTAARTKSQGAATSLAAAEKRLDVARKSGDPKKIAAAEAGLTSAKGRAATSTAGLTRAEVSLSGAQRTHATTATRAKDATNDYKTAQDRARGSMDATEKRTGKLRGAFGGLRDSVKGVVGQLGALAGLGAVAGGVKILGDSVKSASEAEQAVGAVDQVFGKSAANVKKNAESAATSLGLTRTEYMSLTTVLGSGLKNKGIKDFAGQSQKLVGIGADLSAMYGGTTKEAVEALGSAMRGEMDPIEKYGVTLNADMIKAQAISMGLVKNAKNTDKIKAAQNTAIVTQRKYTEAVKKHGKGSSEALKAESAMARANGLLGKALEGTSPKLNDQQKATAALALVQTQTKDAQGQFGRESNTLAGQQERLKAQFGDMKVELGKGLLPILTNVVSKVVTFIDDFKKGAGAAGEIRQKLEVIGGGIQRAFAWMKDNPQTVKNLAIALLGAYAAYKTISAGIRVYTTVTTAARAATAAFTAAKNLGKIAARSYQLAVDGSTKSVRANTVAQKAAKAVGGAAAWTTRTAAVVKDKIATAAHTVATGVSSAALRAQKAALTAGAWITNTASMVANKVAQAAHAVATWLSVTAVRAQNAALIASGWVVNTAAMIANRVATIAGTVASKAMTAAQWLLNAALRANPIGLVITALVALGAGLVLAYKKSETFRNIVNGAWNAVKTTVSTVASFFSNTVWPIFRNVLGWIGGKAKSLYEGFIRPQFQAVQRIVHGVATFFRDRVWPIFSSVFGWVGGRAKWLYEHGVKPAFDSVGKIVHSTAAFFRDKVWPIFSGVLSNISGAFGAAVEGIGRVWSGIQAIAAKPIEFVLNTVVKGLLDTVGKIPGLGGPMNSLKTALGIPVNFSPKASSAPTYRRPALSGANRRMNNLAGGGVVTGPYKGAKADNVLGLSYSGIPTAWVNPREMVVNVASTRKMNRENPGVLDHINRTGSLPGLAKGGLASLPKFAGGGQTWPLIWNYVRERFPGIRMTSNFRPGARSLAGPVSSHALGTAIDIGGSQAAISKVMTHMASKFGSNFRDLIYSPLWGHRMIYQGRWIQAPDVTYRTHSDHGHLGLIPGRSLTGGPAAGMAGGDGGGVLGFDPVDWVKDKLKGVVGQFGGNPLAQAGVQVLQNSVGKIGEYVMSKVPLGGFGDVLQKVVSSTMSVARWEPTVRKAMGLLGIPATAENVKATLYRIGKESSGDPNITQKVNDVNSRSGNHARGLMQVIPPTFRANAMPGYGNILNPLDNLLASMRYALGRYGSLTAAYNRPGGYAKGTKSAAPGLHWVGERGPELVDFRGGERVYTHQESQQMTNSSPIHITINGVDANQTDRVARELSYELSRLSAAGKHGVVV